MDSAAPKAQKSVVETVGLPKGCLITEARIAEARKLPPIAKADAMSTFGVSPVRVSGTEKAGNTLLVG